MFSAARRSAFATLLFALAACGPGASDYSDNAPTPFNVVLVTLDGVRWQELFAGSDPLHDREPRALFKNFHDKVAPRGALYGDLREGSEMVVTTTANASLPGYMSILAERPHGCLTNFCERIKVPTMVDRMRDELSLPQDKVQVVAAWPRLKNAVSSRDDVARVLAGTFRQEDEATHPERALLSDALQTDRGAVLEGFRRLKGKPRFLMLSLLDSDRFGHFNDYPKYAASLAAYDALLVELVARLDAAHEFGANTALVITTDHGRGLWDQWGEHGPQTPSSRNVWAFVMLPKNAAGWSLAAKKARRFDHDDVRYTVEVLLGLGTPQGKTGFVERTK